MGKLVRFGTTLWSIVECAQAGDRTAMDRIMRQYRPALVNFAVQQGLKPSEAEDAAQDALLRLMNAIKSVDSDKGRFRSLLLAITRNVVFEILRKRGKTVPLETEGPTGPEREESFDRAWAQNLVLIALEEVRKDYEDKGTPHYQALRMRIGGKGHDEMAEALKVPVHQVKNYLHQAREKLRKRIEACVKEYTVEGEFQEECRYLLGFLND